MSSQLDYWKAMNAKNAETMSQGSRVPKDSQVDTQSKSRQSHDDISDDISSSRFHGESHEEYREQYNDRNLDQSRNQIYGHGRSNGQVQKQTRKYHLDGQTRSTRPSRRNVLIPIRLILRLFRKKQSIFSLLLGRVLHKIIHPSIHHLG